MKLSEKSLSKLSRSKKKKETLSSNITFNDEPDELDYQIDKDKLLSPQQAVRNQIICILNDNSNIINNPTVSIIFIMNFRDFTYRY